MGINLNKVEDSKEGNWIDLPGEYLCRVQSYEPRTTADGKKYYRYLLVTKDGKKTTADIWDTEPSRWRLKQFAMRCGLTEREMEDFEWGDVLGKLIVAVVEADKKGYHHAEHFKRPTPSETSKSAPGAAQTPPAKDYEPTETGAPLPWGEEAVAGEGDDNDWAF